MKFKYQIDGENRDFLSLLIFLLKFSLDKLFLPGKAIGPGSRGGDARENRDELLECSTARRTARTRLKNKLLEINFALTILLNFNLGSKMELQEM